MLNDHSVMSKLNIESINSLRRRPLPVSGEGPLLLVIL